MASEPTDTTRAARCREMADKTTDERKRLYWLRMSEFWSDRHAKPASPNQNL